MVFTTYNSYKRKIISIKNAQIGCWVRSLFCLIKSISLEKVKKDSKTFLNYKKLFTKYQISAKAH
jgi:hypothetical protein